MASRKSGPTRRKKAAAVVPRRDRKKSPIRRKAPRSGKLAELAVTPAPPEAEPPATVYSSLRFPVVGIGTSAGGLEALESFLKRVPRQSGMAFVVVQHMDPTHKGMLVELLQRVSLLPVEQATDGVEVEADHVYVIPPNRDLSLLRGKLHLFPQPTAAGLHLPIDFFFRSLADDQQERSIGVILSGMGSDGTLGLRSIKEKAGAAFVQAPSSAKFDGMPRSAIEAGLADIVAPAEDLPAKILAYRQHARHIDPADVEIEDKTLSALQKVYVLLRSHTGNDFSLYKKSTILRRIERRMGLHQIDALAHYVRFLRENPREIELLFKELLIGVTSFFRDPECWAHLSQEALPALLASSASEGVLRAWIPGCSTGEEAYSLAMIFKEAAEPFKSVRNVSMQIFGTDLDRDAIDKARQGLYPDTIAADVPPERLRRFFVREERGFRVAKEIRELVIFAPQNIIMDPPFTKLDLISCRNLLIYLSGELQRRLIPLFHYSLNQSGLLMLGSAETIGSFSSLFAPLDSKIRLYRRLNPAAVEVPLDFPFATVPPSGATDLELEPRLPTRTSVPNLQVLADRVIVQKFSPLGVLCNEKGDVLYVSGRAGKYLEPAVGRANLNVFAMARDGLRHELSRAFSGALRHNRVVHVAGVKVGTNGGTQHVNVTVQKLSEPKELRGTVMVLLADASSATPRKRHSVSQRAPARVTELLEQLQTARDEAQTTREEMQTSQEELKSTNEELQSTNEELQSTNEELTTSKEEMQSLNEELQTVNHELQSKVDELSRSNNDMKNLLNSTDIATLFLDGELRVRRFTTPTSRIIKLIAADAGRPITDIASDLQDGHLVENCREVLRTLAVKERQVETHDGRWFNLRIMPYRAPENVIDGVVITFTDAGAAKSLEKALLQQANELKQMAESLPDLVWYCREDGSCELVGPQWLAYTGAPENQLLGFGWLERVHERERDRVREEWRTAVKSGARFNAEFRVRGASGGYRWFRGRAIPIRDETGEIVKWYGVNTDIDDALRLEPAREAAAEAE
jgi:two-component system CheB/CheR fusion protein